MRLATLGARKVAIAAVVVLALVTTAVMVLQARDEEDPTVYAVFADASPLIEGNDVKSGGVKVGSIVSIEVEDGRARLGLRLDESVLPLHEDARATVRPVGLLGERYVEIERGTPDAPELAEGDTIPMARTGRSTDLDEVLNTIDDPTGTALATLVTTLGEGVHGRGGDVDAAIRALAPALTDVDALVTILDDQTGVLNELIDSVQPVAQALAADDGKNLDRLVGSAEKLLAATSSRETAMDDTLKQLPSALTEARTTLQALHGAAESTTPNLKALRPTTSKLSQLSKELTAFSKATDPALNGLDPVLEQAKALIDNARPVAQSLRRQSPELRGTVHQAKPVVNGLLDNLTNVLDFVKFWALTTNGDDALAHYFRAHLVVTDEIATGLLPAKPSQPKPPKTSKPGKRDPLLGNLEDLTGTLLPDLLGNLDKGSLSDLGLLKGNRSRGSTLQRNGSATGLTSSQESQLLNYLIGSGSR